MSAMQCFLISGTVMADLVAILRGGLCSRCFSFHLAVA